METNDGKEIVLPGAFCPFGCDPHHTREGLFSRLNLSNLRHPVMKVQFEMGVIDLSGMRCLRTSWSLVVASSYTQYLRVVTPLLV